MGAGNASVNMYIQAPNDAYIVTEHFIKKTDIMAIRRDNVGCFLCRPKPYTRERLKTSQFAK